MNKLEFAPYNDAAILCYVDEFNTAYFTTQSLDKQTGDDWDEAPFQSNAGEPYTSPDGEWEIYKVKFEGNFMRYDYREVSVNTLNQAPAISRAWVYLPEWCDPSGQGRRNWTTHFLRFSYAGSTMRWFMQWVNCWSGTMYMPAVVP